jgi:hypothetical protein
MSQWENPLYVEENSIEIHVYRAKRLLLDIALRST